MGSRSPDGGGWGEIEVVEEANGGGGVGVLPVTPSSRNNSVEEEEQDMYVAVGEGSSSMDALTWALKHVARPSGIVYLVHVFPAVHHIPTPLGMLPRDQVSQAQVNSYLDQERVKRRDMLQKFLAECQKSRMNFDTHLIESDQIVKAVAELIEVLHIKRLIVGVNKSNLRKMKKASCKAVQIQKSAAQYCEVKIICEGREVRDPEQSTVISPAAESLSHDKNTTDGKRTNDEVSEAKQGAVSCSCFSVKLL
ncbi:U-box domain-containing protein 35-like isoform X1 [Zingiber officinale]|uniref:U-box domain-containing protein 35-like isoform X1 n=1 Tax=Zingiber officinale TaxID=94328 RepID=UPI001C4BAA89|nr:U-box domain-containing protein 35-like isoform X1 [Zingiber officinale]